MISLLKVQTTSIQYCNRYNNIATPHQDRRNCTPVRIMAGTPRSAALSLKFCHPGKVQKVEVSPNVYAGTTWYLE